MGALLGALLVSYLLAAGYTLWLNPEVRFWTQAYEKKASWADDLSNQGKRKLVFVGGSSCAFQIDAGALTKQHGIPSVNMGMAAGMSPRALAATGLTVVRPGDVLVIAIEPGLLLEKPDLTPMGYQILTSTGILLHPGDAKIAIGKLHWADFVSSMRPGLYNIATMMGKVFLRRDLYRYGAEDIQPGGGLSTKVSANNEPFAVVELNPDPTTMKWLQEIDFWCVDHQITVYYLIPQQLFKNSDQIPAQQENRKFLKQIAQIVPIAPEASFGVLTDSSEFADTSLHLTRDGQERRTRALVDSLRQILLAQSTPDNQAGPKIQRRPFEIQR
ncbi:hypothetical protein BH09VER1_BH09VER1_00120 [soil metagenome]